MRADRPGAPPRRRAPGAKRETAGDAVIWHDLECGGYTADLGLWGELAADAAGPVLELGCGTGRVGVWLARQGHEVIGLDRDAVLAAEFARRAAGLPARSVAGDARDFELNETFSLALAPMQLIQLLDGAEGRQACLGRIAARLPPGGLAALALVEEAGASGANGRGSPPPLPDTREIDGFVYSSLPLPTVADPDAIHVRRLRQIVSPDGRLQDEESATLLRPLTASRLEREAGSVGLTPLPRRRVPPTEDHVGSTVVVLRREAS
jgi:SAM-dependent methyltransferase